jgi:hypothetical protein
MIKNLTLLIYSDLNIAIKSWHIQLWNLGIELQENDKSNITFRRVD